MKKSTIFLFILLLSASVPVLGQKVGFQMGLNFSNWNPSVDSIEFPEQKPLISPSLGILVEIPVNEGFFISSGVFTRVKGIRFESVRPVGDVIGNDYEMKETNEFLVLWYLNLPVNFGYKFELDNGLKLYGKTGPTFDFGIYSTNLYRYDSEWDNQKTKFGEPDLESDAIMFFNKFDFGWNIEAGLQVSRFQFSLFYNPGFTEVFNADDDIEEDLPNMKNYVYGFKTAILFGQMDNGRGSGRGSWRR